MHWLTTCETFLNRIETIFLSIDDEFSLPNASEVQEAWNKSYIRTSLPKEKHVDLVS